MGNDSVIPLSDRVREIVPMDTVVVTASRVKDVTGISPVSLSGATVNAVPKFLEADPLRSILILPGVSSGGSDFNTQIYLRGGNSDETMIALDGVPLYNPFHFGGLFSMINADILEREDVYRSNYPVWYGGAASGVVDMITKERAVQQTTGSVGIAITSLKGNVETPVLGGSLFLSARRFWFDLTRAATPSDKANNYFFYDLYGRYVYPIGATQTLSVSHYHSRDVNDKDYSHDMYRNISIGEPVTWYNRVTQARWTFTPNDGNTLELALYRSEGGSDADVSALWNRTQPVRYDVDNTIAEDGMKFSGCHMRDETTVSYGVEAKRIRLEYRWDIRPEYKNLDPSRINLNPHPQLFFDFAPNRYSYRRSTASAEIYAAVRKHVTERIDVSVGFRGSYVHALHGLFTSPYVGLQYAISPELLVTAGYGRYYQYLYTIKDARSLNNTDTPFNAYFLSADAQQVKHSDHFALGVKLPALPFTISAEIEGYYKDRRHIAGSYSLIDRPLVFENGAAYGVDVLIRKTGGPVTGMLAYSFSRSVKRNPEYTYFVNSDRTHTLKGIASVCPLKWLTVDCVVNTATGVPYTDIIGKYIGYDDGGTNYWDYPEQVGWNPIYGRKNGLRSDSYTRVDIGFTGAFPVRKVVVKPFIQILNIFDSPNPYGLGWLSSEHAQDQNGSSVIPAFGITVDF